MEKEFEVFSQHGQILLLLIDLQMKNLQELEKELSANGCKVKGFKSDASNFDDAQQLAEDVLEEFGSIDVLVNNGYYKRWFIDANVRRRL